MRPTIAADTQNATPVPNNKPAACNMNCDVAPLLTPASSFHTDSERGGQGQRHSVVLSSPARGLNSSITVHLLFRSTAGVAAYLLNMEYI